MLAKTQVYILFSYVKISFVCLFGIASPQVGLPGPYDFVNRSLTPGKDQCSLSLRTHECRADFLTLRICRPATPLILCFSSVHLQTQLSVSDLSSCRQNWRQASPSDKKTFHSDKTCGYLLMFEISHFLYQAFIMRESGEKWAMWRVGPCHCDVTVGSWWQDSLVFF